MNRRDEWLAESIALLLFAVYLLTFSGRYHASDEMSMLAATDSLARRGAWDTELIRWMGEQQGSFGPDGHLYSRKGIGTTLAALPAYWYATKLAKIGNVQAAMLTTGLVTALTGVLLYLTGRRLGYGVGAALGAALGFGLATMAWPYARTLFSEPLAGLGVLAGAYFLLRYRDRGDAASLLLAGSGLGVALLARLNNAIAAPLLGIVLIVYVHRRHGGPVGGSWRRWLKALLFFSLPVLAALAVTAWYNWLRFGSPLTTGYLPEERFSAPFFQGLYGLTLSPGKGLLWYNPILFAALAAWPALIRRHRTEGLLAAGIVVANIVFYAPWYLWWGGHGWGPRFLVAALPFAALPLAEALDAVRRRRLLAVGLAVLALVSAGVQILGTAVDFNLYLEDVYGELGLYHPATLFDPAYSPLLRQVAYVRLENLDLAWARGAQVDTTALWVSAALVLLSAGALAAVSVTPSAARRAWFWLARALTPLVWYVLVLVTLVVLLPRYSRSWPAADVAQAAQLVDSMEKRGDIVIVADHLLTESFQDAYDGRLPMWGVPSAQELGTQSERTWLVGAQSGPAAARFQVGSVPLALITLPDVQLVGSELPPLDCIFSHPDGPIGLMCAQTEASAVRPGDSLRVVLVWRALGTTDTSYTVFVQAIDEQGIKAGQLDRLPCDGACLTSTWRDGDVVGEWLDLPIRPDAPPGRYQVIAGLYDLATGQRLAIREERDGEALDYVLLGVVDVRP